MRSDRHHGQRGSGPDGGGLRLEAVDAAEVEVLLPMIHAFHAEDGYPTTPASERAARRAVAGDPMARAFFLVADDQRVGYAVLTLGFSIEHGGRDGFIDELYVLPEARGRGYGAAAMALLETAAASLGVQALHLEVGATNGKAEALYRGRGYRVTDRKLMSKRLAQDC